MEIRDFKAIRISLASPEEIRSWSYGEVTKPETINYRRLRPEKDGLFCEAIFGPTRDWQCYCGKYKKIRYRGIVCDKCGVEVTRSRVRRERMGHIELASPAAHIWYTRRVPSYLGLLLNISRRNLDRVLYFAQYIVSKVDEQERKRVLNRMEEEFKRKAAEATEAAEAESESIRAQLEEALGKRVEQVQANIQGLSEERDEKASAAVSAASALNLDKDQGVTVRVPRVFQPTGEVIVQEGETIGPGHTKRRDKVLEGYLSQIEAGFEEAKAREEEALEAERERLRQQAEARMVEIQQRAEEEVTRLQENLEADREELATIKVRQLINESRYRAIKDKWGSVFHAGMGAEALLEILEEMDLEDLAEKLRKEIRTTKSKQRKKKATKRLKVGEALRRSGNRPEWMVHQVLPVIPPDLRPMVQLDGGRFATSDLNDLYRRVINRNNRLKRLLELGAPDVIIRNEKRMLQEAVDSLIDNSRRGKAVSFRGKRQLKSLSDMLKGKQGRFRRNLLGKRVDYSGRSVIVIGPHLKLHQCGLPKTMALELFRPFVMRKLVEYGHAHNVKGAKRVIEQMRPEVWEVLEEVIQDYPVLLNRAPTLHRLGIQAFEPVLVEGKAIQIHPLVCFAFNADFDGDQMAIHIPLSERAKAEARELMMSNKNLLLPANGEPVVGPTKDMVLGAYYSTMEPAEGLLADGEGNGQERKVYGSLEEVQLSHELGHLRLHQPIRVLVDSWYSERGERLARKQRRLLDTTVGRVLFNLTLPPELRFRNETMDKGRLKAVVADCYTTLGPDATADLVDEIKDLGFRYATQSGMTIAVEDLTVPEEKALIIERTTQAVAEVEVQYKRGLITAQEMYEKTIDLWTRATDEITDAVARSLEPDNSLRIMAMAGATKGGFTPIRQLAGMRGLMADPAGRIIDLPIRSNFREGLSALEYFISTHGARKGLADTALRTADAGYLTRRLVDVAQEAIVNQEDCGTREGVWIRRVSGEAMGESFRERLFSRVLVSDVIDPKSGKVILETGTLINEEQAELLERAPVDEVQVRSPLACSLRYGVCAACYGRDLARGGTVRLGEAVGIIAAQSIGEPGTQLTLRTFHTGGVHEAEGDITHGLPRVQELFEARNPKGQAIISDISGTAEVEQKDGLRRILVRSEEKRREVFERRSGYYRLLVEPESHIEPGTPVLGRGEDEVIVSEQGGRVVLHEEDGRLVIEQDLVEERAYDVPAASRIRVSKGSTVEAGQPLTEGPLNPHRILQILGRQAAQEYLLEEIQGVYRSQGVVIHDKHIEMILRQMFSKVRVTHPGDTDLLLGDLVNRIHFQQVNEEVMAAGGQPATAQQVLLGITKAALNTESFLAASSFQHTINVLASAAIEGKVDELRGLKENVIIGKLIPAGTGYWARIEEQREADFEAELLQQFRAELEEKDRTILEQPAPSDDAETVVAG